MPILLGEDHFKAALAEPPRDRGFIRMEVTGKAWRRDLGFDWSNPLWWYNQAYMADDTWRYFEAVARGNYWLVTITDEYRTERWQGFKLELLAIDDESLIDKPASQIFPVDHFPKGIDHLSEYKRADNPSEYLKQLSDYARKLREQGLDKHPYGLWRRFGAWRVTSHQNDLDVRLHSWPWHDNIITVLNYPIGRNSNADFKDLKESLTLFNEPSGRPLSLLSSPSPRQYTN